MPKLKVNADTTELDMTPVIDMVFLLILFFILGGKITSDVRVNWVTVPPTQTAEKMKAPDKWLLLTVSVAGNTQPVDGRTIYHKMQFAGGDNAAAGTDGVWYAKDKDDYNTYIKLRAALDRVYEQWPGKFPDPKKTGMMLPQVVLEIRADSDTQYRVVQEIMQVASDSVDPNNGMKPKAHASAAAARPFVNLFFTTFKPGDN